ncbi:MAG: response regulator [Desulfotignum sp.]|nr:response regulator [Desulfotignum sp.]
MTRRESGEVLEITLTDAGYEVLTAENGFSGFGMVKTYKPDIVLTDIRMPGMDLLKSIKQSYPDIEVIMITGYGDANLAIESLKTGAVDFISKPVNQDVLEIALKRANDRIRTREKLADHTRNLETLVAEKTRKLAESEKRYVQLFNESPAYITILDEKFRIIESNNRFKDQFGDHPDLCCYQVNKQQTIPCDTCPVKETFADGRSHTAEMDVTFKDGRIRRFFIQTSAIPDDNGRIRHVMEMSTDITVIHQLQDHLAVLGLHISSISHGIKGMLTGLDGGDYLIRAGLENAVDACVSVKNDRKKLTIQIQVTDMPHQVLFKFRDNGKGLDKEYRQKIFSLFYSDKGNKGTGLGLFIARRSVQQHQGEIHVDSVPGKFTEFIIAIPKKSI